jgi:hypothetical protein
MATPILGITEMTEGQSAKHVTFNEAINDLDEAAGPYLLGLTYDGSPGAGEVILRQKVVLAFSLPASLTGSSFYAETAANSTATFTIKKNGGSVGTLVFSASGTSPAVTFSTAVSFAVNDKLTLEAPNPADSTLADLGFTFKGSKVLS